MSVLPAKPLFAACLGVLLSAAVAHAQRGPAKPPTEPFEAEGTVEAIGPAQMQIATNANQKWLIGITPQTKVELTGTATADFLRPGMCVMFDAELDKHGVAQQKVTQLSTFTPSREKPLGLWTKENGGDHFGAAVEPAGPAAGGKKGGKLAQAPASLAYSVAARIINVHGDKLTLSTGDATITIETAEDAKVDLKLADYSFARQGDKVTVKGQMLVGRPGIGQASELKIVAAQPLSGGTAKSKPAKPPATKHEPKPRHPPREPAPQ